MNQLTPFYFFCVFAFAFVIIFITIYILCKYILPRFVRLLVANSFLKNLGKNILNYIIFILPFILVFKALYNCWLNGVWNYQFFSQQFISNFPFVGNILYGIIWKEGSLLSVDILYYNQRIMEVIFVGGLGGSLGRTIVETYFSDFAKVSIGGETLMSDGNINAMNQDSASKSSPSAGSKSGSSAGSKSGSRAEPKWISEAESKSSPKKWITVTIPSEHSDIALNDIKNATEGFKVSNEKSVYALTKINESNTNINLKLPKHFWTLLKQHSNMVNMYFEQRITWVEEIYKYLHVKHQTEVDKLIQNKRALHQEYLAKVEKLSEGGDLTNRLKEFYNLTNAYRNSVNKEVNTMEWIVHESIRHTHPLYKNPDLKQTVNIDYPKFKKNFADEDQKLRKRFSEILNASKK